MTYYQQFTPDLVTLGYVRQMRELADDATATDALLTNYIHAVSAKIQSELQRVCMPYLASKEFDYISNQFIVNPFLLDTKDDLLAITQVLKNSTVISSAHYYTHPRSTLPANAVRLRVDSGVSWMYDRTPDDTVTITGVWGYVPQYANAYRATGIVVPAGGMTDSQTTLTVSDSSSFDVLQYLRVDEELMQVTANNTATNTLTITRAELGTSAETHDAGVSIERFVQLDDLQNAAAQTVSYLYKTQHQLGGRVTVFDGGTVQVTDLDPTVQQILNRHRKLYFGVI